MKNDDFPVAREKIYISSPYSKGDIEQNVKRHLEVSNELINMGFAPFTPLLSHFQNKEYPQSYETWLDIDLSWIDSCNYLLRLPGESNGADREVKLAIMLGIRVFYSIEELKKYFHRNN